MSGRRQQENADFDSLPQNEREGVEVLWDYLKRDADPEYKDERRQTSIGTKTKFGLAATMKRFFGPQKQEQLFPLLIKWGEGEHSVVEGYAFESARAREAFLNGVDEADGWFGYQSRLPDEKGEYAPFEDKPEGEQRD